MAPKKTKNEPEPPVIAGKDKKTVKEEKPNDRGRPVEVEQPKDKGFVEKKEHERLPLDWLHKYIQKNKLERPQYSDQRVRAAGMHQCKVTIPNLKNREKDLVFTTREEFPFPLWAKNMSAMLALFHFEPDRPYERIFPEPYGSVWASLSSSDPLIRPRAATVSVHEAKAKEEARKVRQNQIDNKRETEAKVAESVLPTVVVEPYLQAEILQLLCELFRKVPLTGDAGVSLKAWLNAGGVSAPAVPLRTRTEALMPFSDALSALEGDLGGSKGILGLLATMKSPCINAVDTESSDNKKKSHSSAASGDSNPMQQMIYDALLSMGMSDGMIKTCMWGLQLNLQDLKRVIDASPAQLDSSLGQGGEAKSALRDLTAGALVQWCVDFATINLPWDKLPRALHPSSVQVTVGASQPALPLAQSGVPSMKSAAAVHGASPTAQLESGRATVKLGELNAKAQAAASRVAACGLDETGLNSLAVLVATGHWQEAKDASLNSAALSSIVDDLLSPMHPESLTAEVDSGFVGRAVLEEAMAEQQEEGLQMSLSVSKCGSLSFQIQFPPVQLPKFRELERHMHPTRTSNEQRELYRLLTDGSHQTTVLPTAVVKIPVGRSLSTPSQAFFSVQGANQIVCAVVAHACTVELRKSFADIDPSYDPATALMLLIPAAHNAISPLKDGKACFDLLTEVVAKRADKDGWVQAASSSASTPAVPSMESSADSLPVGKSAPSILKHDPPSTDASTKEDTSDGDGSSSAGDAVDERSLLDGNEQLSQLSDHHFALDDGQFKGNNSERSVLDAATRDAILKSVETPISRNVVSKLPSRQIAKEIKSTIRKSQVVFVKGETGSGKTTQVPRLIMEDCAEQGDKNCLVICSQPRRLAAVSVAARVADECGVPVGGLVGHQVRYDVQRSTDTRLCFMTHGILIRKLISASKLGDLGNITHVVIDEVHERSVDVDLLLLLLARCMCVPGVNFKVILMSASVDPGVFEEYFTKVRNVVASNPALIFPGATDEQANSLRDKIPQLNIGSSFIPGRTFPVEKTFARAIVTDVLPDLVSGLPKAIRDMFEAADVEAKEALKAKTGKPAAAGGKKTAAAPVEEDEEVKLLRQMRAQADKADKEEEGEEEEKEEEDEVVEADALAAAANVDEDASKELKGLASSVPSRGLDPLTDWMTKNAVYFICRLVEAAHRSEKPDGAIVIFVQGSGEIDQICQAIERGDFFSKPSEAAKLHVVPCHAQLEPAKQQLAFKRPPEGKRKVVVATNVAETSITIDDCTVVIDTGLQKSMMYDGSTRTNSLQTTYISQSSAQQRAGRAGRVRAGKYYSLLHEEYLLNGLPKTEEPEICRVSLEEAALLVKRLFAHERLASVFASLITPPPSATVLATVRRLKAFAALDGWERLTAWGAGLSELPLEVPIARSVLMGAALGCVGPVLAAAASAGENIFLGGQANRESASAAMKKFDEGAQCDFVAKVRLLNEASGKKSNPHLRVFCDETGLNPNKLRNVKSLHQNLVKSALNSKSVRALTRLVCSPRSFEQMVRDANVMHSHQKNSASASTSAVDLSVPRTAEFKACMSAGLAPQVAAVRFHPKYSKTISGAMQMKPAAKDLEIYTLEKERGVNQDFLRAFGLASSSSEGSNSFGASKNHPNKKGFRDATTRVFVHPGSVNFDLDSNNAVVAYLEKLQTSKTFLTTTTVASPVAVMIGATELDFAVHKPFGNHLSPRLTVDGWHDFKCAGAVAALLRQLRSAFWTSKLTTIMHAQGPHSAAKSGVGMASRWRDESDPRVDGQRVVEMVLKLMRLQDRSKPRPRA